MSDDKIRKKAFVRRLKGKIHFEDAPTLDGKRQSRTFDSPAKSTAARLSKRSKSQHDSSTGRTSKSATRKAKPN